MINGGGADGNERWDFSGALLLPPLLRATFHECRESSPIRGCRAERGEPT